jgi:hypothetical protein
MITRSENVFSIKHFIIHMQILDTEIYVEQMQLFQFYIHIASLH